jgi:hypothetical protein
MMPEPDTYFTRIFQTRCNRHALAFQLLEPNTPEQIQAAQKHLNVTFPDQITQFYLTHNGFSVNAPHLEVLGLERLTVTSDGLIHFATLDQSTQIAFDTHGLNDANCWMLVFAPDRKHFTFTMRSFLYTRMWSWLERRNKTWELPQG